MGFINFSSATEKSVNNQEIEIRKGPETLRTAKEVSDFLKGLPLSACDNDKLVQLLLLHTEATAREAFSEGVEFASVLPCDGSRQ